MSASAHPPTRVRSLLRFAAGLAVIVALMFVGDAITAAARLPLPGSVVGMLLLAAALRMRWISPALVQPAAEMLIRNMALLFVPAGVGLMLYLPLLRREWVPIVAASVASTFAVLVVVAWTQQRLERDD
ncbi:MAG TPA: CidA/LrgA family protein [Longimicrobium sp.]|jgi:holin-like protein|uniref:CidA/LrgA family protein n=1 Tax=Longimicrobium sp. TaxID=2029185 RepID=UPI002EDA228B